MNITTNKLKIVGTSRYSEERTQTRMDAIDSTKYIKSPTVLELYGAGGFLTKIYKEHLPNVKIIRVDTAPGVEYHMSNDKFIDEYLTKLPPFDIIDFDAYGDCFPLIHKVIEKVKSSDYNNFIVTFTNGLGLHLKLQKKINWMKRFLIEPKDVPDLRHPWQYHIELTRHFFNQLSKLYQYKIIELKLIQGQRKNYVFGTYLFKKI